MSNWFGYKLTKEGRHEGSHIVNMLGQNKTQNGSLYELSTVRTPEIIHSGILKRITTDWTVPGTNPDKCVGILLGGAIGDALGTYTQYKSVTSTHPLIEGFGDNSANSYGFKRGQYTGYTAQSLCLADTLIARNMWDPIDFNLRLIAWWHYGYNNGRGGNSTIGSDYGVCGPLLTFESNGKPYTDYGDTGVSPSAAATRISPIAIRYVNEPDSAREIAKLSSRSTFMGDEAYECAMLFTDLLIEAIRYVPSGSTANETSNMLKRWLLSNECITGKLSVKNQQGAKIYVNRNVDTMAHSQIGLRRDNQDWNWRVPNYVYPKEEIYQNPTRIGSRVVDCFAMSLNCIETTQSYAEAVLKAINICGDSCAIASMTGTLAGAIYGASAIPIEWRQEILQWDGGGEIALRAIILRGMSISPI
ncbi:MAG TPA: ADP-ribosylglycohydrolase family protein [Candidatus Paceibacterota bacterium]